MNKQGPIIIIEDDQDDRDLIAMVFKELRCPNMVHFFPDGEKALHYLKDDTIYPFLILSDINMPRLNGFELRKMVHTNDGLSEKCIPYLFFSTDVNQKAVSDAYTMSVQGFFLKPSCYDVLKDTLRVIIEYWNSCYSPNNFHDA